MEVSIEGGVTFASQLYRVNETNVSALMSCALPYHSTLQFVRLVQTMRLGGLWTFLAPMQQSGAPLPRTTLVQRCCTDAALLQFVCQAAQQAASPAWLSFYGVVVCEVIAAVPKVRSFKGHSPPVLGSGVIGAE